LEESLLTLTAMDNSPSQLSYALTELPELRMIATDPFVPSIVRKKVVQAVLQDTSSVKVSEVSKRLLGTCDWVHQI